MENKRLIVFFAVLFSIVFSIVYYALFTTLSDAEAQKRTLYTSNKTVLTICNKS